MGYRTRCQPLHWNIFGSSSISSSVALLAFTAISHHSPGLASATQLCCLQRSLSRRPFFYWKAYAEADRQQNPSCLELSESGASSLPVPMHLSLLRHSPQKEASQDDGHSLFCLRVVEWTDLRLHRNTSAICSSFLDHLASTQAHEPSPVRHGEVSDTSAKL